MPPSLNSVKTMENLNKLKFAQRIYSQLKLVDFNSIFNGHQFPAHLIGCWSQIQPKQTSQCELKGKTSSLLKASFAQIATCCS